MLAALCFDLDGTLIDSTDAIVDSFVHTFKMLGRPEPTRERIIETISVPLEQQFGLLSVSDSARAAEVYREHYLAEAPKKTTLLPGVNTALNRFKAAGLKLSIATSKQRSSAEPLLEHLGVLKLFDVCVGPEDVRNPKPHPECLHLVLKRLEIGPKSMIFVGDSKYDIQAAHAAGVRCVGVSTGYSSREELRAFDPEIVLGGLEEFADYVLTG